jgi:hypothetical protein
VEFNGRTTWGREDLLKILRHWLKLAKREDRQLDADDVWVRRTQTRLAKRVASNA